MPYRIAGVDEAGRGPLAGPVVAAAVIFHPEKPIEGLADSKKLTEKQREQFAVIIYERALAVSVGMATVEEIDQINILQATLLAMQRAVLGLPVTPELVLVDGNRSPELSCPTRAIIKGDQLEPVISAASIIAKVTRDKMMLALDTQFPEYQFAKHKGYPTAAHRALLKQHGPCIVHRRSFGPVKVLTINDRNVLL